MRRDAESKLLRHRYKLLLALPNPDARLNGPAGTAATSVDAAKIKAEADAAAGERKRKLRDMVAELVRGMVLIGVPDELAWNLRLDWMDVESLGEPLLFARSLRL